MNLKEIKEIINLMNENDLTEIEIEREGIKVKIKKSGEEGPRIISHAAPTYHVESQPAQRKIGSESGDKPAPLNRNEIKSPMVGTFYRSPSPDSPAFVEVGDVVEVGQVVCIVEAMKLMNEIKSEIKGRVSEIPVENAQPVEFGQALFYVEPL